MPSRAKLTTRGISATTVTTETLPKNAALTNNELDSNFINLRDQTFAIVGDDSTGIDIRAGDTIKFTGSGGATVTAVGNTITIGGSSTGDLTIIGSTISGPSNADINITAGGTGDINLNADTVRVGDSNANATITTNGTGSLLLNTNGGTNSGAIAITAGLNQAITLQPSGTGDVYLSTDAVVVGNSGATATITTNGSGDLVLNTNSGTSSGVIKIAWNLGGNIDITPSGTGKILLDNNYWPNTDGTNGQTLITDGAGNLSWSSLSGAQGITFVGDDSTGTRISDGETVKIAGGTGITTAVSGDVLTITATGGGGSTGDLTITGTTISAGTTNADITITSSGTGNLNVNMDTMRIGDANTDATITTNGTGDLTLTTNSGTNSGTIQIDQGANQNILIIPNGTGKILLDDTYWPNADGTADQVLTTNGAGQLSWQTIAGELFELVGDDSTGTRIKLDDTFKIAGGTGIDTAIVGDTLTITNTGVPGPPGPSAVGITFVGDDSTGTLIADGETVKIAGAGGITTSMSGDVLTISGAQGITFVGDDSTGTRISDNETVKIAGAGSVSTAVSGDIVTITGTDTNTTYSISAETATGGANLRLTDSAAATDDVKIASGTNITVSRTDANTITIDGPTLTSYLQNVVEDTTPQLGGNLDVNGKIITSVGAGNIELQPDSSGDVYLTADTVRVGDSNANATITTNGTGDLTINTNSGTNSNSIVIEDTATGRIQLIPNSTGRIDLGPVADGSATGLTNFPSAIGGNGVGVGDARIKGSGRFYSNLAYTPYTAATSQEVTAVDYTMLKTDGGSFDSTNIRQSAANHFMLFDLNGGSATTTTTNVSVTGVGSNNNQLWYMNNAGGTKTGLNIAANRNSVNIVAGHGGTLTIPRSIGYLTDLNFAANNTDTTTITEAWAFRDQGPQYSSSSSPQAVPGTNQVIGNYYAFETGLNYPTLVNNTPWAFYIRTSSQNWRSRIGAVDLPRRWSTSATHSSGGTYTINFQTTGHGFHQITLTSNITSFTMSNFPTSTAQICEIDLVFIQDGTGGRTISFTPAGTEVFKFRNGTNTLADSTAAPEILHAKVFTRYDGSKTIYYWDIDNREYV